MAQWWQHSPSTNVAWFDSQVLLSAPRGFSLGTPVFPSHQKPTFDLIQFDCGWFDWVSPITAVVERKSNAKGVCGKQCWSNYVGTRELVKSLFYSPKPFTASTPSLSYDIQDTCKKTFSLSPHHFPVKCWSKCIKSNLHVVTKTTQRRTTKCCLVCLHLTKNRGNMIIFTTKPFCYKGVTQVNAHGDITSNFTSLSSHFLTMMSSPVMSLILYIMFVADSCASRITPTIATLKQVQQA